MSLFASLDLGTNTFRLLIAEITSSERLVPILIERVITRLGEGFYPTKSIQPHARKKSLAVLEDFSKILNHHKAEKVFAVSTSVAREAQNGKEFISEIFEHTGIPVKILTGFEEAQLTLKGVLSVVDYTPLDSLLVFDIGGGSTEFILTKGSLPIKTASISLGVVHLAEKLEGLGPPSPQKLLSLRNIIKDSMYLFDKENAFIDSSENTLERLRLIGTAGTVTTLAAIHQEMEHYTPGKINNYSLSQDSIENIYSRLTSLSLAERTRIIGLEEGREAVIVPGTAIVLEIMDFFRFNQLTVTDAGLLEGILLDAYSPLDN